MPVYLFALSVSPNLNENRLLWSFVIIHLLLYPASNGYNSYFDKDEQSIGGLKHPPAVKKGLYYTSILLDIVAVVAGLYINTTFGVMLFVYGMVSKAYSHPSVRLKKYPIGGWLVTGIFQGFFTFLMCYAGINNFGVENFIQIKILIPSMLSTMMLWANYPMTQIYQHEEDRKHGDTTLSMRLGVLGTFYFAGLMFALATVGFMVYFVAFLEVKYILAFLLALTPVVIFFLVWFLKTMKSQLNANYSNTMWLNLISSVCLNGFFIYLFLDSSQVLQAIRGGY